MKGAKERLEEVGLVVLLVVVPVILFLPTRFWYQKLLDALDVISWCYALWYLGRKIGGTRWWASMDLKRKCDIFLGRLPWSNRLPLQKFYRHLFPSLNPSPFLLGYRFWSVCYRAFYPFEEPVPSHELISVGFMGKTGWYCWQPGPNQSECLNRHKAPAEGCMCGFWFRKWLWSAKVYRTNWSAQQTIIGAIVGWGRCIEHSNGIRCEKAMVIGLLKDGTLSERHIQGISEYYDVPIFDSPRKLKAYVRAYLKAETEKQKEGRI